MKKIKSLLAILAISLTVNTYAQSSSAPAVTLGNIAGTTVVNGKEVKPVLTREQILANPRLMANDPGAVVTAFTISIGKGKATISTDKSGKKVVRYAEAWGPVEVKGNELPEQFKKMLLSKEYVTGTVMIEGVKLDYQGKIVNTNAVQIDYNK